MIMVFYKDNSFKKMSFKDFQVEKHFFAKLIKTYIPIK